MQGIMNSINYQEILVVNVMQSVTKLKLGRCWKWPSQSPDLNPIENLWWDLKKAVAARMPKNVNELEAFTHEEWAQIPAVRCKKLVSSYV